MVDERNVVTFQRASTFAATAETIFVVGTASVYNKKVHITDLKCGLPVANRDVKIWCPNYSAAGKEMVLGASSTVPSNYNFDIPYTFNITSSTGQTRHLVASASDTDVDYVIIGYVD